MTQRGPTPELGRELRKGPEVGAYGDVLRDKLKTWSLPIPHLDGRTSQLCSTCGVLLGQSPESHEPCHTSAQASCSPCPCVYGHVCLGLALAHVPALGSTVGTRSQISKL